LRRVLAALDAWLVAEVRWRGAALDRLLDEDHATIVALVVSLLTAYGWETRVELTYSEFGERGSFDILAWHAPSRTLLVIEIKTDLPPQKPRSESSMKRRDWPRR
jgi:hypothetical protein